MDQICQFCNNSTWVDRVGSLRDSPDIGVVQCAECGVVIPARTPSVPVNYAAGSMFGTVTPDFAVLRASGLVDSQRRVDALFEVSSHRPVIDIGCGAGGFLSLLKHNAPKYGVELDLESRRFCIDSGLEVFPSLNDVPEEIRSGIQVVTMFHVLEHISDPKHFLESTLSRLPAVELVVVEVPCSEDPLLNVVFSEPFANHTYWSHHCHLHSMASLQLLLGSTFGDVTVERVQRYSLANHLGWLTNGAPGGDARFPWASGTEVDLRYRKSLVDLGFSDTLLATARPLRR